jgi:hypothetical protein
MTKITEYFNGLNLSALPQKASEYVTNQILTDADIDLLDESDEDFVAVKELIEIDYPNAIGKGVETTPTPTESPEIAEWTEATETLKMLIEVGGNAKDIAEWNEAVETLDMLIDTQKFCDGGCI